MIQEQVERSTASLSETQCTADTCLPLADLENMIITQTTHGNCNWQKISEASEAYVRETFSYFVF